MLIPTHVSNVIPASGLNYIQAAAIIKSDIEVPAKIEKIKLAITNVVPNSH